MTSHHLLAGLPAGHNSSPSIATEPPMTLTPFTQAQAHAYLERGGANCPRCDDPDVQWSEMTFEAGVYLQVGTCPHCTLTWHNVAPLTDIVLPANDGDSVTYSIHAFTADESAALIRAIDLLGVAGCRASAATLERLLLDHAL